MTADDYELMPVLDCAGCGMSTVHKPIDEDVWQCQASGCRSTRPFSYGTHA